MCSRFPADAPRGALGLAGVAPMDRARSALGMLALAAALACRGDDPTTLLPAAGATQQGAAVRTSDLLAGPASPDVASRNPYAGDSQAMMTGRRLYAALNCAGCHGPSGGGGIGPPFADAEWIYGGQAENIVQSILQGRPNGMPAFGGKLPPSEAWKIAGFVEQLAPQGGSRTDAEREPAVGGPR
jgi:cytochrome c oxidase cbb3-type subunit 3